MVQRQQDRRDAPVFIGGAGRSGTTLLRVMLNAHPHLCSGPEFKLLPAVANLYQQTLVQQDIMKAYSLERSDISASFALLVERFFEKFRVQSNASRVVEKTPHNVLIMNELGDMFPKAKFIHVIRDGRDVVNSLRKMNWTGIDGNKLWYVEDVLNAATYWVQVVSKALQDAESPQLKDRVKVVRYEELVDEPMKTMQQVLAFLDEPWSDDVLNHTRVKRGYEPEESSTVQVNEKIHKRATGKWVNEFTRDDLSAFEHVAGHLLVQLGYEPNHEWVQAHQRMAGFQHASRE
ncbi:MAG TPA: sulfotransferase [Bacillales bacterium]|nr:sulfotransferase [Bacillales bacterium]